MNVLLYPIAYSEEESRLVCELPENGRKGFKLAKAMRIATMFPPAIQRMLQEVFSTEDCLKTYIIKTSAIMCHRSNPDFSALLSVEEWALLISMHLHLRLIQGELYTLFASARSEVTALFYCSDSMASGDASQYRRCCVERKNLLVIVAYLKYFLMAYLESQNRGSHIEGIRIMAYMANEMEAIDLTHNNYRDQLIKQNMPGPVEMFLNKI